ncbi:MAG: phosphoribosyltransferase family protein [Flavobacteriaceae bacterium]|jgi:pyrimidine operon attenuation protein/uracil phosphoribosyltransferase
MFVKGTKIVDAIALQSSIKRIAYQIFESTIDETEIVIVGVGEQGKILSSLLGDALKKIGNSTLVFVNLTLDKTNPLGTIKSSIPLSELKNKSLIIVDDVLNTGSTLMYAVSFFLSIPVKQIKTAVMVNRNHKKFPIKADFKGISLSTSLNEHITVLLDGDEKGVYLS